MLNGCSQMTLSLIFSWTFSISRPPGCSFLPKSPFQVFNLASDPDLVSLSKYLTASAQLYRVVLKDIESTGTTNQPYRHLLVLCKSKANENLIWEKLKLKLK